MEDKPLVPRLETPQTAHIRASYPTIEYLENDYVADWLKERCDQLLELGREERSGINANKLISGAVLTTGFFLHALSPLAPIGVVLGLVGYVHGCFLDASRTGSFSPLPFVRGNILDLAGTLGNAELRELQSNEANEFEQLQHYLSPRERKEYEFLNTHFALLTDYLTQVEPLKRFHAYRWIFDSFLQFKGALPNFEQVTAHLLNVAPDLRVDSVRIEAIEKHRAELEVKKPKFIEPKLPKFISNEELYGDANYKPNQPISLPESKEPTQNGSSSLSAPDDVSKMNQNAWDILQALVTDADKSKLGGCVILAAPGAGKTTYLGTAWGRLKQTYGSRFNSLAIVVKDDDVEAFRGVSDNCLGVEDSPRSSAIAILRFIDSCKRQDGYIKRLFLDDFLTMNQVFKAALGGLFINPTTFDVVLSKKEDIDAQPLLPTLYAALNKLWLVGRENNAALWVSSHSSNVDALPFVGSRESRSVGTMIFLAHNDKREFIEQALNNPNLIADNLTRQQIKTQLDSVEEEVHVPLVLANFNNWTFGIVPSEVHDEYQQFRKEWSTVLPTVKPAAEKLSDVIKSLEKSLQASNEITFEGTTEVEGKEESEKVEVEPITNPVSDKVMQYFDSAKNKEPKMLRDLKKADRLAGIEDVLLTIALTELVMRGRLTFNGKDSWSKVGW
ncbi:hypothetical protein [Tolypothrix sp. VBCCA 56010]|uniref:hypothetical protein n=1 Tax=Tolypothrix sp. VBCCA 56010 TaxID=3137731 RepID=UPI003D7DBF12